MPIGLFIRNQSVIVSGYNKPTKYHEARHPYQERGQYYLEWMFVSRLGVRLIIVASGVPQPNGMTRNGTLHKRRGRKASFIGTAIAHERIGRAHKLYGAATERAGPHGPVGRYLLHGAFLSGSKPTQSHVSAFGKVDFLISSFICLKASGKGTALLV